MQLAFLCELNAVSGWAGCHRFTLFPGFGRFSAGLIPVPHAVEFGFAMYFPGCL
jgi:hypothetical protein